MKKIFVSIASFKDVQLKYTIESILTNAKYPERIIFGICNQDIQENLVNFKKWIMESNYNQDNFRIRDVLHTDSDGCCWARTIVQSLLEDEELYMQIDAHLRFVKDWDILCEEMLEICLQKSEKPVISSYATICELDDEKIKISHGDVPFRMRCDSMYDFPKVRYIPESIPKWEKLTESQPWHTISAHFIFTISDWVREVPYDPELYFDGEEDTLGVRSWTRGWDIYYPHKVICYHYYIRKGHDRHYNSVKTWGTKDLNAKKRLENIWNGKVVGPYGLGTTRTLEDYRYKYGVDYLNKQVYAPNTKLEDIPKKKEKSVKTVNKKADSNNIVGDLQIKFQESTITKLDDRSWKEIAADGNTYNFEEIEENDAEWYLIDKGRSLDMKLKKNGECWIKFGNVNWYLFRKDGEICNKADQNVDKKSDIKIDTNKQREVKIKEDKIVLQLTDRIPVHKLGNKKIAMVTLGTPNIENVFEHSRKNQEYYCQMHDYNYIYYMDTITPFEKVTWNKVYVLDKHLGEYDWLIWIDSDAIITNMDILLEDIIEKAEDKYSALFCDDIGGWKLNSGVMFWKNDQWSRNAINKWLEMEKLPHSRGAEQQQLINLLPTLEQRYKIFPRKIFNQHPDEHQEGDFILHMMGKSGEERIKMFKNFNMNQLNMNDNFIIVNNYHNNLPCKFYLYDDGLCCISDYLRKNNIWEPHMHKIFEKYVNKDSIVVEGGCHIGSHTLKLAYLCKHIYAFEPMPESFDLLNKNLDINNLNNVTVIKKGLSNNNDKTHFEWITEGNPGGSGLADNPMGKPHWATQNNKILVDLITIDLLNLDKLDFIKLDIEGYESKAIEGAIKTINKFKPIITMEFWSNYNGGVDINYTKKIFNNLLEIGYSCIHISGPDFLFIADTKI